MNLQREMLIKIKLQYCKIRIPVKTKFQNFTEF